MSKKSAKDFNAVVEQQTNDLTKKCERWQQLLDGKSSEITSEDVKGQIRTTIGQARLLMKERFGQFRGLVDDCEAQRGERLTTIDDLDGFWAMIVVQIEDVNRKFALLDAAEMDGWRLPEELPGAEHGDAKDVSSTAANDPHHISFESTERVKEEAEKSETVKERQNELRNFIAQKKEQNPRQSGDGELFVDIKAP